METTCSFHRNEAAHFECHECGTTFCDRCVSVRELFEFGGKKRHYFCPACNIPVQMISVGNIIEPFWHRLSGFFLYPLQPTPLILTLVLALLGTLFPSNIFMRAIVWVVALKYAFATLTTTAQGGLKAPAVSWQLINQDVLPVFKQYVVFFIIGVLIGLVFGNMGVVTGYTFMIIMALIMPVIIMLLVATDSILHALNPMLFIPVITRIGWPYLLLYFFLTFLFSAPAILLSHLPPNLLPMQVWIFFYLFLTQYYTLISYHLMGYVLLQFHDEIGYSVDYDFFIENRGGKKKMPLTPVEEIKNSLAVLIKTGRHQEAIERLAPHIHEENPDTELSEKFLQLLKMNGEQERAARYALRHFELLVENKKKQKALDLFSEIKKIDSGKPAPESVFTTASWYQDRNEFKQAMETYVYFLKQFKNHPLQPETYFNLATLLHERGNNSAKAKQILSAIVKHYPQHDLSGKAKEYLALVS